VTAGTLRAPLPVQHPAPGGPHAVQSRSQERLAAVFVALPAVAPLVLMKPAMMIAIVEPFARLPASGCEHDESQQEKASDGALDVSHFETSILARAPTPRA
jgi:hypothetical protein